MPISWEALLTDKHLLTSIDPHTQYAKLSGRSGGQTLIGSSVSGESLTLKGNSIDANFGNILSCSILPINTETYNLGSTDYVWNNSYIKSIYLSNINCLTSSGININDSTRNLIVHINHTNKAVGIGSSDFVTDLLNAKFGLVSEDSWAFIKVLSKGTTTSSYAGVVVNSSSDQNRLWFLSHYTERIIVRCGITLGGWTEIYSGGTNNSGLLINTAVATPIVFGTDNVERLRIDTSGNIGIGTAIFGTSAAKVLALYNGTAPSSSPTDTVQLWSADRNGTAGKASLHLRTEDGTSHVFGDKVGIGTTSPAQMLDVYGNIDVGGSDKTDAHIQINALGTSGIAYIDMAVEGGTADYDARLIRYTGANGNLTLINRGSGYILLSSNLSSSSFIVDASGNIGVGTYTFGTSAAKVMALYNGTTPTTSPEDTVQLWCADRGGTAGKAALHLLTEDGTSHVFGDRVGIGTASPGAYLFNVAGQSSFGGNVYPAANNTYNLGSPSLQWNSLSAKNISCARSNVDIYGTVASLTLYNNYATSGTYYNRALLVTNYINSDGDQTADNTGYDRGLQVTNWLRENAGTLTELTGVYVEYGAYGPAGADLTGTIATAHGLRVFGTKVSSATITTNYGIKIDGTVSGTTAYGLYIGTISGTTTYGIYQSGSSNLNYFAGNIGLGTTSPGSSLAKGIAIASGTGPTTAPADMAQLWVRDANNEAGKASLHMMSESGTNVLVVVGTIIKSTTGDPEQVHEGLMCINTVDKNIKLYAGGAWRTITTWT